MRKNIIFNGDSLKILALFEDCSIDLVVTSPPYDDLRSYNGYAFPFEDIVKELYRIMKNGGVIVWIVGDATIKGSETGTSFRQALYFKEVGFNLHDTMIYEKSGARFASGKKSNRYSQIFEYMFVFSKGKPKVSNLIADKKNKWAGWMPFGGAAKHRNKKGELTESKNTKPIAEYGVRNNIFKYSTGFNYTTKDKIAFQHPAIFPEKLAEDHILTWSNEGDLILDPFCGSGTTLKMAYMNKRKFVGVDVSDEYCKISQERLRLTCDIDVSITKEELK